MLRRRSPKPAPDPVRRRCPYAAAQIIGRRGEGVLRFPEAVALDAQGNVYVADQLSYRGPEVQLRGCLRDRVGVIRRRPRPVRTDRRPRNRRGVETCTWSTPNTTASRSSTPNGNFLRSWGGRGSELGRFSFGSSRDYTHPPGGGIAVAGSFVYVADSGNDRIERFNLEGGEAMEWGSPGSGPGQFSYPRGVAANASEVLVADDDNHRIQKFDPNGGFQTAVGSQGSGPGQFGFPYGDHARRERATPMSPTTSTTAS